MHEILFIVFQLSVVLIINHLYNHLKTVLDFNGNERLDERNKNMFDYAICLCLETGSQLLRGTALQ